MEAFHIYYGQSISSPMVIQARIGKSHYEVTYTSKRLGNAYEEGNILLNFYYQTRRQKSDRTLLEGYFMLWLKGYVMLSPPSQNSHYG